MNRPNDESEGSHATKPVSRTTFYVLFEMETMSSTFNSTPIKCTFTIYDLRPYFCHNVFFNAANNHHRAIRMLHVRLT